MLLREAVSGHPSLRHLVELQLRVSAEHERFLSQRFAAANVAFADRIASLVEKLAPDLEELARDYHWLCDEMNKEELYFRRTGEYRLSTFEAANREIYANADYMRRYMNGVLLSHIFWDNHARVIENYASSFLPANRDGYRHLEVGPGHGLLLYLAASDPRCATATGWDVSDTSIAATRTMLARLGVTRPVELVNQNIFDAVADGQTFDSIVISEVCEHLEDPKAALAQLRARLAPGGRIFINIPVNSPAPDHIYLLRTPEEVVELVRDAGLGIESVTLFPMTGLTEKQARKLRGTISCVVVGTV